MKTKEEIEAFTRRLDKASRAKRWLRVDVSTHTGLPPQRLSAIYMAERPPEDEFVRKAAAALEVNEAWLRTGEGDEWTLEKVRTVNHGGGYTVKQDFSGCPSLIMDGWFYYGGDKKKWGKRYFVGHGMMRIEGDDITVNGKTYTVEDATLYVDGFAVTE